MSEEARPYRHTAGDWGPHKSYKIEHKSIENDDGTVRVYADAYIASGDKIIAEVQMRTGNCGWPHVENMVEFKANVALISAAPNLLESQTMGIDLTTPAMLDWAADRLVEKGDHPNSDFILSMRERAKAGRAAIAKATTY